MKYYLTLSGFFLLILLSSCKMKTSSEELVIYTPDEIKVLFDNALRPLGAREILRPHVRDLFTRVAESAQPSVARVDEEAVLVQRDEQRRAAAEQPLIFVLLRHGGDITVFRHTLQRKIVIHEIPLV